MMIEKIKKLTSQFFKINYEHIDSLNSDNYVTVGIFHFNYDSIVSAIIKQRYPSDRMQAVINNYLLDPEDEEIKREFQEMQAWRAFAKETAKAALVEYDKMNSSESNEEETN